MSRQSVQHIIQETATADIFDNNVGIAREQFLIDKKSQQVRPNTIKTYRQLTGYFLAYCEEQAITMMSQITPIVLSQYMVHLQEKGYSKGNVITNMQALKVFIRWYYYYNDLDESKNPFNRIKMPKRESKLLAPVTDAQIEAMLKTCKDDWVFKDCRDKLLILMLRDTGARGSEICSILRRNIDDLKQQIFLESEDTKGGKSRYVGFTRETKLVMNKYIRYHAKSEKYLFTNRSGDKLTFSALRQAIQDRAKRAGIKEKIKVHAFRRYFILQSVRANMPLLQLSRLVGHRDTSLLSTYAKTTREDLESAYKEFFENRDRDS